MIITKEEALRHLGNLPRELVEKMCDRLDKLVDVVGAVPEDICLLEEKLDAHCGALQSFDQTRLNALDEAIRDSEYLIGEFGHEGFQKILLKFVDAHRDYLREIQSANESVFDEVYASFSKIFDIATEHAGMRVIIDPTQLQN